MYPDSRVQTSHRCFQRGSNQQGGHIRVSPPASQLRTGAIPSKSVRKD
jgi:hypothetical protein